MRVAICQTNIIFEKKELNINNAKELIYKASINNADLVLFPEMSFTGFSMNIKETGEQDDFTIKQMSDAAKKYKINIGFGYVKLINSKGENHYCIINTNGEMISDYIKIHSFAIGGEKDDFISGNTLPSPVSISGHSISTFICYDLRFPELFRAAADNSSIITIAANWPRSRREHWLTLLKARAIENQLYIIGVNCIGTQGNIIYNGDSVVIDPLGNTVAMTKEKELLICDIKNDVISIRNSFPVLKSRKPNLYKNLILP